MKIKEKKLIKSITLTDSEGNSINTKSLIDYAISLIKRGNIIGVKGVGGFHLICNGRDYKAVKRLRTLKNRPHKPFAMMGRDIDIVKDVCSLTKEEEKILISNKKPIVILKNRSLSSELMDIIAPKLSTLGIMLPYTELHRALFGEDLDLLIVTSGNISGGLIEHKDVEAIESLKNIVDYFLVHDINIEFPIDDSLVKVFMKDVCILRIGREYAPKVFKKPVKHRILALGSEEKNTFSLSNPQEVYVSQHLGDLKNLKSYNNYVQLIEYFKESFYANPKIIAYDMHPNYVTQDYVSKFKGIKVPIQHHHAHMASCLMENSIYEKVIGVIYDGTGYGLDGAIWGGEFFIGDMISFRRIGHFKYVSIQGGDRSIKEPWRTAASYLYNIGYEIEDVLEGIEKEKIVLIKEALKNNINCYKTSSVGRFFDAIASLLGLRNYITYDGQAAIELESLIGEYRNTEYEYYNYFIHREDEIFQIQYEEIIRGILKDMIKGISKEKIALKFHNTISEITIFLVSKLREVYGINKVILSGGVFQNDYLLNSVYKGLNKKGFEVFFNREIPINDGGISFGQIAIANAQINSREGKN